jgi:uncharacterized protein YjiS (DUF1127 family)
MSQMLKRPFPSITAAHLAAFTTVSEAPELHSSGFRWRDQAGELGAVVHPQQWWRTPAIVMRGYRPRAIEPRRSPFESIGAVAVAVLKQVAEWRERVRSRHALLRLDDHALRDIGLDRARAEYEAGLPFWREQE